MPLKRIEDGILRIGIRVVSVVRATYGRDVVVGLLKVRIIVHILVVPLADGNVFIRTC